MLVFTTTLAALVLSPWIAPVEGATFNLRGGPKFRNMRRAGAAITGEVLAGAPVNNITITTSNVVQCGQAVISWTGATNPSSLAVGTGGYYVGITNLETIPNLPGPSTEWTVAAKADTDLIFQITDANGVVAYAQNVRVQASADSWCLDASAEPASSADASVPGADPTTDDVAGGAGVGASSTILASASASASSVASEDGLDSSTSKSKSSSASPQATATSAASVTVPANVSTPITSTSSSTAAAASSSSAQGTLAGANAGSTSGALPLRPMSSGMLGLAAMVWGASFVL